MAGIVEVDKMLRDAVRGFSHMHHDFHHAILGADMPAAVHDKLLGALGAMAAAFLVLERAQRELIDLRARVAAPATAETPGVADLLDAQARAIIAELACLGVDKPAVLADIANGRPVGAAIVTGILDVPASA